MTQSKPKPKPKPRINRDIVFERLSVGCPFRYRAKGVWRCESTKKFCLPKYCGPYHWWKK